MGLIGFVAEICVLTSIVVAVACNGAVVGSCEVIVLSRGAGTIGPWRADIEGSGCQGWDKDTAGTDWLINMARACSMMGLVFGCILAVFGFFNQCLCPLPCTQKILDISGVATQISLALTWPMIRSSLCDPYGCEWGGGATALLLSQLFYFIANVFARCMREPRYKRKKEEAGEEAKGEADPPQQEEQKQVPNTPADEEKVMNEDENSKQWFEESQSAKPPQEETNSSNTPGEDKKWYD